MAANEGYYGNPNLRNTGETVRMTPEQMQEYVRCYRDPVYFITNYIKIINIDHGLMKFDMYEFQKEFAHILHNNRFVIAKLSRQVGKTTTITSYLLHYILFNPNVKVAILANKADTAQEILGKLQLAYLNLPAWLQHGISEWNKRRIKLENGSIVKAASTSSSSIRGESYNVVFLDEFAHIENNLAEEFFRSVYPVISSGKTSKVFAVSTPKGMNHFFRMWTDAKKAEELRKQANDAAANKISRFVTFEADWWDVPGRDEEWREQEEANLGSAEAFEQEYGCEFIGSSNTLIGSKYLRKLGTEYQKPLYKENGLNVYEEPGVEFFEDDEGYKLKRPRRYVICADTSYGRELDYSAFTVFDVSRIPYRTVASYRDNKIPPIIYPTKVVEVAKKYHDAYILCETNDVGNQVAQAIHYELEYENLLKIETNGKAGQAISSGFKKNTNYGLKMSSATKRIGCSNLKALIEGEKLRVLDLDTIAELTNFVQDGNSYAAEPGSHDDLVMTLVMFGWLTTQRYFKELLDSDIRKAFQVDNEEFLKNDMLPDFFFNDGAHDEYEMVDGLLWTKVEKNFWDW